MELAKDLLEGTHFLPAEIGDRFEVWLEPIRLSSFDSAQGRLSHEPECFEIASALEFQPAAGAHPVEIAQKVELQKIARPPAPSLSPPPPRPHAFFKMSRCWRRQSFSARSRRSSRCPSAHSAALRAPAGSGPCRSTGSGPQRELVETARSSRNRMFWNA